MGKLNKESSVALYQQLIDEIKNQITSGKLAVGDRLMTEFELSQEYNVSRITVRKAIEVLVEENILIKKQGIGTSSVTGATKKSTNCSSRSTKPTRSVYWERSI